MRDGGATWRIDRSHPSVALLLAGSAAEDAEGLLKLLEENLPIHDIHIHTANDQPVAELALPDEEELEEIARRIVEAFSDQPEITSRILERLPVTEPFNRNPDAAIRIAERLRA
jgi:hypothetical protein